MSNQLVVLLVLLLVFAFITLLAAVFLPDFFQDVENEDDNDPFDPDII